MKKYKSYFLFSVIGPGFLFFIFTTSSCSKQYIPQKASYQFKAIAAKPDYQSLHHWAAHPWKKDPSDSVPRPILPKYKPDSSVDVFFIHPTTLLGKKDSSWNGAIDNAGLNAKTDYSSILYQASVFNEYRVFAPRYRQAHYNAYFIDKLEGQRYFDTAYEDVKAAFSYYLRYHNGGRPIFLAAHSQGTQHAARLIQDFFDNKPLLAQLICAYLVGMPVPENYFSSVKYCNNATETGCFVSWRSYKNNYEGPAYIIAEPFKAVVTNPLSWKTGPELIPARENKGALLKNFNKIIPHAVSSQVHGNILWVSKPDVLLKFLIRQKNYHIGDINLFYMNIRENLRERLIAFRKK